MSTGRPAAVRAVPQVVLLVGTEPWLRAQEVARLKAECLSPGFEDADFTRFTEPPEDPLLIQAAARTAPLGSARRLVLVEGIEECDRPPEKGDRLPWLSEYLRRPNPQACLVLCADRIAAGPEGLLGRAQASGVARIVSCQPLKGRALADWLTEQARRQGKALEPRAAALLIGRIGSHLQGLALALEVVSIGVGAARRIVEADVKALVPPSLQETAFEILDDAASGRKAQAMEALHQGLTQGRLALDGFLGAAGWYYRAAWKAQASGGAGAWIFASRRAGLLRMQRWPPSRLRKGLEELVAADLRIKRGHPMPEWLVERLLLGVA